ncbi:MAG: hypothetical protein IAE90_05225 [Ignavibacteria bacterium]|nr:hypothetical protein [Ignavibacteria bacterium]
MLKFLKKLFDAEVIIAPVVSVNDEEVKTYNTVAEAITDLENDPNLPKEKLDRLKAALSELKLTGKVKIKNGEVITEEAK